MSQVHVVSWPNITILFFLKLRFCTVFSRRTLWICSIVICCVSQKTTRWNIISTMDCHGLRWFAVSHSSCSWYPTARTISWLFVFIVSALIHCRGWKWQNCGICASKDVSIFIVNLCVFPNTTLKVFPFFMNWKKEMHKHHISKLMKCKQCFLKIH